MGTSYIPATGFTPILLKALITSSILALGPPAFCLQLIMTLKIYILTIKTSLYI